MKIKKEEKMQIEKLPTLKLKYTLVVRICQEGMKKADEKANCFLFRLGCPVYQVFVRIACTVMKERNVHSIIIV